jgi:hypothetical protein
MGLNIDLVDFLKDTKRRSPIYFKMAERKGVPIREMVAFAFEKATKGQVSYYNRPVISEIASDILGVSVTVR